MKDDVNLDVDYDFADNVDAYIDNNVANYVNIDVDDLMFDDFVDDHDNIKLLVSLAVKESTSKYLKSVGSTPQLGEFGLVHILPFITINRKCIVLEYYTKHLVNLDRVLNNFESRCYT